MNIRTLFVLCSLPVLCLLPSASFAQAKKITLDVAVSNGGKPVPSLTAQDFTVTDKKKPVQNIELQTAGETNIVLAIDTQDGKLADMPKMLSDLRTVFTRNGGKLPHPMSVVVIGTAGSLRATEAPTTDGAKIIAFLDTAKTTQVGTFSDAAGIQGDIEKVNKGMLAFTNILNTYTRNGGRNMVIWVGRSWPIVDSVQLTAKDEDAIFQQIVAKSNAMRTFRVVLYSADPTAVADSSYQTSRWRGFSKPQTTANDIEMGDLALEAMAVQSGGQVYNSISNVAEELDRCFADADNFYTISFDGTPASKLNEYHPLTVNVAKPGLVVRARQGYYAQP